MARPEYSDRLGMAIRKLYRYRKPGGGGGGLSALGGALGGIAGKAIHSGKEDPMKEWDKNHKTMKDAINRQTMDEAIKRQTMQSAIESGVQQNWIQDNARAQQQNQKVSDAALLAPVNGQMTQSGTDNLSQNVENNVHDINLSKQLMGQGMAGSVLRPRF